MDSLRHPKQRARACRSVHLVAQRPTGLTGAAGEYYVAAELSRRGWLATVTVKNAPGTDVLRRTPKTKRTLAIQTKTSSSGTNFTLGEREPFRPRRSCKTAPVPRMDDGPTDQELLESLAIRADEDYADPGWHLHIKDEDGRELTIWVGARAERAI